MLSMMPGRLGDKDYTINALENIIVEILARWYKRSNTEAAVVTSFCNSYLDGSCKLAHRVQKYAEEKLVDYPPKKPAAENSAPNNSGGHGPLSEQMQLIALAENLAEVAGQVVRLETQLLRARHQLAGIITFDT